MNYVIGSKNSLDVKYALCIIYVQSKERAEVSKSKGPVKRSERIQIQLTEDELQSLDSWRFENHIPSRAAAIRELMRVGLSSKEPRHRPEERRKSSDYGLRSEPG